MHRPINEQFAIQAVSPSVVRPLRQRVLRPHQTLQEMIYDGDDSPQTIHLAAANPASAILAVASLYRSPHPVQPEPGDWQLRGMAVAPECAGRGLGKRLVEDAKRRIAERAGRRIWCNARQTAQGFYLRQGFATQGERFDLPDIGPHVVMSIAVSSHAR